MVTPMYDELIKSLREDHGKQYFARDREAADAIEELQKQLEESYNSGYTHGLDDAAEVDLVKKMSYWWIPVTERLPEVGEFVLIYRDEDVISRRRLFIDVMVTSNTTDTPYWYCNDGRVLYWMPLPQPPESEGK